MRRKNKNVKVPYKHNSKYGHRFVGDMLMFARANANEEIRKHKITSVKQDKNITTNIALFARDNQYLLNINNIIGGRFVLNLRYTV